MCNLYSEFKGQAAIRAATRAMHDYTGNLPPMSAVFPDMIAPVVRKAADGERELAMLRWGLPTLPTYLKAGIDPCVTNIRNPTSPHWRAWHANRCVVPATSFCEPSTRPDANTGKKTWPEAPISEALALQRPLPDEALLVVASGDKKDEERP